MSIIDWDKFTARVPAGTHVSAVKGEVFDITDDWQEVPYFGGGRCGILLSFDMSVLIDIPDYFTDERGEPFEAIPDRITVQPFDFTEMITFRDPSDLEYLINNKWLTFAEVMA